MRGPQETRMSLRSSELGLLRQETIGTT